MSDLYIVDAVNYVFRSYYAIGAMTNREGVPTGGLYGFIRSLEKLFKTYSPQHFVAVFDGPDNARRRQALYPDYKRHRKKAPEDLYSQIGWAYEFCEKAGIPCLSISGVEADDTMATIALWAKEEKRRVYLCTSDKDLLQLISEDVYVLNMHKDPQPIDAAKVEASYGVRPDQMLDLLALMGDASDNIPGLSGFGLKTASRLLNSIGSLEYLLDHPEEAPGAKKQETLREGRQIALLSKQLATLYTEVHIPKEWSFYKRKDPDTSSLQAFYQQMDFHTLLKELPAKAKDNAKEEDLSYTILHTHAELAQVLEELRAEPFVAFDVETTSLEIFDAKIVGLGLSSQKGTGYYIPGAFFEEKSSFALLKDWFMQPQIGFIAHHAKYDLHILKSVGIEVNTIAFDTMIASHLLYPGKRKHTLSALCLEYFDKTKESFQDLFPGGKEIGSLADLPEERVGRYCCEDVDYTFRLAEVFREEIRKHGLEKVLYEIEIPLIAVLVEMEQAGIFLDTSLLGKLCDELLKRCSSLEEKIYEEAGSVFNMQSPKQLSEVLFTKLGIPKPKRAKTATATGAKILESLASQFPVVEKILDYRMVHKLLSTYALALPKAVHPRTKRIHCTFNQSVVSTGRIASHNPNLQNIPVRSEEGRKIRQAFRPEKPDWFYLAADYSQIELRLLAHFSQDATLIEAFLKGKDIHAYTASLVHQVPIEEVTREMRRSAKAVNFGIVYGQSAFGLSQELGIPQKEAEIFIKTYFARYPGVAAYLKSVVEEAKEQGYSSTIMQRKRPLPDLYSKNGMIQKAAQRLAINTPLQGSAADLIKLAMVTIAKKLTSMQSLMVLQVHDELIFELPEEELSLLRPLVQEAMENALPLRVPLVVDLSIGKNWAEC